MTGAAEAWEWEEAGRRFPAGRLVTGPVVAHRPFGVFVGLGDPGATGLVQIPEFLDAGRMTEDQYPPVGSAVTAVVLGPTDAARRQVWLSLRPARLRAAGAGMEESEWRACTTPVPMLEYLRGRATDRKVRLFAVACCRSVRDHLWAAASVPAVAVAERFADGRATAGELAGGRAAVRRGLELFPGEPVYDPAFHACGAGLPGDAEWCAFYAANVSTRPLAGAADDRAGQVRAAEVRRQSGFLRDIFGNPLCTVAADPAWLTSAVLALACQMYDSREFTPMPILADALQDAGCGAAAVLAHCRDRGPHVRGCWVVDMLLGKE